MAKQIMTTDEIKLISSMVHEVWQYIGSDAEPMCGDDNEGAIEVCLDADRLITCTRPASKEQAAAAQALLRTKFDQHGYIKVMKVLTKNIRLV